MHRFLLFWLFFTSCLNGLHKWMRWIGRIASDRQICKERFLLCVPLHTIFTQMRSSLTKNRYTQRLARSTERDTWRPFYAWKAPFLNYHRSTNQPKPQLSSVTFLHLRVHTADTFEEQEKKKHSWMKVAVLSRTVVFWKVQLRELGWKIKSRELLKGKVTFFMEICHVLNLWSVDRLMIHTEKVWNPYSVFQKSTGCKKKSPWHQFTSSFPIISGLIPSRACHVSLSLKGTSVCL